MPNPRFKKNGNSPRQNFHRNTCSIKSEVGGNAHFRGWETISEGVHRSTSDNIHKSNEQNYTMHRSLHPRTTDKKQHPRNINNNPFHYTRVATTTPPEPTPGTTTDKGNGTKLYTHTICSAQHHFKWRIQPHHWPCLLQRRPINMDATTFYHG